MGKMKKKIIRDELYKECFLCLGTGISTLIGYPGDCPHCNGTGMVYKEQEEKFPFKKTKL